MSQTVRLGLCFAFLLGALAAPTFAQHEGHDNPGTQRVPEEILTRPITRHAGLGTMHQKVTTPSLQVQALYDQGLAYLHSYIWIDAARSFHQALRLDPNLGMAWLQLADVYIGLQDVASARAAWDHAHELEQYMSPGERTWLQIRNREIACLENPTDEERYVAYRKAIEEAIKANPHDSWLLVQGGLAVEASPFTHGQASGAKSLSYYRRALALDPHNLAAFHYAIHANENLGHIKEALQESATYARLSYAVPHAHHMRGHELMRMGRTEEAIQEFVKTDELEQSHYKSEGIPPQYDWHHAHNLQLLALNYELLGQMKNAEKLLREAFALPNYTEFIAYNRRAWPEFLLDRGRYEETLGASRELAQSPWPMARVSGHTLAGEAYLALNKLGEAEEELTLAEKEAQHLPGRLRAVLPYPAALRAAIDLRQGRTQEGEQLCLDVVHSAMAAPGPDGWIAAIFVLDSIARIARESGDWQLAQLTAENLIQHDPYYGGGHFALGLVAEHAGETQGSREMFAAAEKLWAHADADLPELVIVRQKTSEAR